MTVSMCSVARLVSSASAASDVPAVTLDWTIEQIAAYAAGQRLSSLGRGPDRPGALAGPAGQAMRELRRLQDLAAQVARSGGAGGELARAVLALSALAGAALGESADPTAQAGRVTCTLALHGLPGRGGS